MTYIVNHFVDAQLLETHVLIGMVSRNRFSHVDRWWLHARPGLSHNWQGTNECSFSTVVILRTTKDLQSSTPNKGGADLKSAAIPWTTPKVGRRINRRQNETPYETPNMAGMKAASVNGLITATLITVALADDVKAIPGPSYAHGTINVVLANQNGAIVETDSRLSFNGRPVGKGQKLFKLDDNTVCAIAGFYTLPFPVFAGNYSPAPSSVPAMIDEYLQDRKGNIGKTLAERMESLIEIFSFDMAFTTSVAASKMSFEPSPSVVTLVGYEDGELKILQAHLSP